MNDKDKIRLYRNPILKYFKISFRIFIIVLLCILGLFIVIKAESLFHFLFYHILLFLFKPLSSLTSNDSSINMITTIINYSSILIQIYLHIVLLRMCIISVIFLLGGILKYFFIYLQFKGWMNIIIHQLTPLVTITAGTSLYNYTNNFKRLKSFQKSFNQLSLTNQSFQSKENQFGNYLNEVMYSYQQFKSKKILNTNEINQLNSNAQNLIRALDAYLHYNQIEILFKFQYSKVLNHLNLLLLNDLKQRNAVNINIAPDFPAVLIGPNKKDAADANVNYSTDNIDNNNINKTLIVFCNQNAVCYEMYHLSKENFSMYLSMPNTSILLWNYKGFGSRKGITTFESIDYDTIRLANYIKAEFPSKTKVVIHGISIGGFAAVRLAKAMNDPKNVLLIADRTMGTIDAIIKTLPYGAALSLFFNALFPKFLFDSSNIEKYIPIRNKMILYDEKDEIISSSANLITNVSYVYFNEVLKKRIEQFLNKSIKTISELPDALLSASELIELKTELGVLMEKTNLSTLFRNTFLKYMRKCPIDIFLMNFFVFGFPFNVFKEIPYNKDDLNTHYELIPIHLLQIVNDDKQKMSAVFMKFLGVINSVYVNVMLNDNHNTNTLTKEELSQFTYKKNMKFYLKENIKEQLINYFGYTKRLFCGHNGKLTDGDIEYIHDYLEANDFIAMQNDNNQIN